MRWIFTDTKLIGPITFETTLAGLIKLIGEPTAKFKRTLDAEDVVYSYDNEGVSFNIDEKGMISQITVFPQNEIFIGEIQLLGQSVDIIQATLTSIGESIVKEDVGLWCEKYNILLVVEEGSIDGVEIYRN